MATNFDGFRNPRVARSLQLWSASGLNVLAGLWLIVSPLLLGYASEPTRLWNDVVVGIAIIVFAVLRIAQANRTALPSWINAILGVWLIVAAFALPSTAGTPGGARATWNDLIVGVVVLLFAVWSASAARLPKQY